LAIQFQSYWHMLKAALLALTLVFTIQLEALFLNLMYAAFGITCNIRYSQLKFVNYRLLYNKQLWDP